MPKWSIWRVFKKTIACGQTVLPDRSTVVMFGSKNSNVFEKNHQWLVWRENLHETFLAIFDTVPGM